jgi:hypothetical protein
MKSQLFLMLCAALLLSSCKEVVDVKNGEIPNQYISQAKPYMGTYRGEIGRLPASITLSLQGNKVVMSGSLPVEDSCQADYGLLKSIFVKKDNKNNYNFVGADFYFDPNNCRTNYDGRSVHLDFKNGKMTYYFLSYSESIWQCDGPGALPGPQPGPFPPSGGQCHQELREHYVTGYLQK